MEDQVRKFSFHLIGPLHKASRESGKEAIMKKEQFTFVKNEDKCALSGRITKNTQLNISW